MRTVCSRQQAVCKIAICGYCPRLDNSLDPHRPTHLQLVPALPTCRDDPPAAQQAQAPAPGQEIRSAPRRTQATNLPCSLCLQGRSRCFAALGTCRQLPPAMRKISPSLPPVSLTVHSVPWSVGECKSASFNFMCVLEQAEPGLANSQRCQCRARQREQAQSCGFQQRPMRLQIAYTLSR